jgi:uncharacterized protein
MDDGLIEHSHLRRLIDVARAAVERGLEPGPPLPAALDAYPEPLRRTRASFVTLKLADRLRGCIGTLNAVRPLVEDVAKNAAAAAFDDPRFPPVTSSEAHQLRIHISVLSPPSPLQFDDLEDLLNKLQPGIHGLVLAHGGRRATYLPSVWDSIPEKRVFVQQLRAKAGIAAATPIEALDAWVYTVQEIG